MPVRPSADVDRRRQRRVEHQEVALQHRQRHGEHHGGGSERRAQRGDRAPTVGRPRQGDDALAEAHVEVGGHGIGERVDARGDQLVAAVEVVRLGAVDQRQLVDGCGVLVLELAAQPAAQHRDDRRRLVERIDRGAQHRADGDVGTRRCCLSRRRVECVLDRCPRGDQPFALVHVERAVAVDERGGALPRPRHRRDVPDERVPLDAVQPGTAEVRRPAERAVRRRRARRSATAASSTVTSTPAAASRCAAPSPASPAPITSAPAVPGAGEHRPRHADHWPTPRASCPGRPPRCARRRATGRAAPHRRAASRSAGVPPGRRNEYAPPTSRLVTQPDAIDRRAARGSVRRSITATSTPLADAVPRVRQPRSRYHASCRSVNRCTSSKPSDAASARQASVSRVPTPRPRHGSTTYRLASHGVAAAQPSRSSVASERHRADELRRARGRRRRRRRGCAARRGPPTSRAARPARSARSTPPGRRAAPTSAACQRGQRGLDRGARSPSDGEVDDLHHVASVLGEAASKRR